MVQPVVQAEEFIVCHRRAIVLGKYLAVGVNVGFRYIPIKDAAARRFIIFVIGITAVNSFSFDIAIHPVVISYSFPS